MPPQSRHPGVQPAIPAPPANRYNTPAPYPVRLAALIYHTPAPGASRQPPAAASLPDDIDLTPEHLPKPPRHLPQPYATRCDDQLLHPLRRPATRRQPGLPELSRNRRRRYPYG